MPLMSACVCPAENNAYTTMQEVFKDVMCVWDNAMRYNAADNPVHRKAQQYKNKFHAEFALVLRT